jgi:dockerin type I repeat protein/cysteine-rich secretory family protein
VIFERLESRRLFTVASATESSIVDLVNQARSDPTAARAQYGLTLPFDVTPDAKIPVRWNDSLGDAAHDWASLLAASGTITHVGADGSVPLDRDRRYDAAFVYGIENAGLSGPLFSTDDVIVDAKAKYLQSLFVQHDGHFEQECDPSVRQIGVGLATGFYNGVFCLWEVIELGTRQPIVGDANNDGVVDTRDFVVMAQNFGQTSAVHWPWESGDFNGDGRVNAVDFNLLASAYL